MRIAPLALLLAVPLAGAPALRTGEHVPAWIEAAASPVADDGRFHLRLTCVPEGKTSGPHVLRVALTSATLTEDHVVELPLKPATAKWRAGERVEYRIPLALPADNAFDDGELVSIRVGFVPKSGGEVLTLGERWEDWLDEDGLTEVASIDAPRFAGADGPARLTEIIEEAALLRRKGDAPAAWAMLDEAFRAAASDVTKARLRDELAEVGELPPPAISEVEDEIIGQRIRGEKVRVLRIEAGRMRSRGQLHGALKVLEEIGGNLQIDADQKVIGAVDDAERMTERIEDLRERLLRERTDEEQAEVDALLEELGRTEALFERAVALAKEKRYPVALECLRELRRMDGIELHEKGQEQLEIYSQEYLAAIPPEQQAEVDRWVDHPSWARTSVVGSHCFLFIGPKELVEGIPDESKLRFDLAYVHLTDLFGRRPNPDGDRVTVYFKELFDFGGGIGGGKIIDIGRAQASPPRPVRVDNGLLYHELTHCVDDTRPVHGGFTEGLANLGAAYTHEALDQRGDALHSFASNLEQFRRYFLDRDLEYWRIQEYGPSAGLFLHFVETYAKVKGGHDWSPLRRFFREYREAPIRDGREPAVMRSIANYLVRGFGPEAFDDLVRFGFPLEESDRWLLAKELEAFEERDGLDPFEDGFAAFPNSQLPRDVIEQELYGASNGERLERAAELRDQLGIVFDWKVIGPFFAKRADPAACPFPPEVFIDFDEPPSSWNSQKKARERRWWKDPWPSWNHTKQHKDVVLFPSGWLRFNYDPYGDDNAAIYALTHVTVAEATDVLVHGRADDDMVLFINDERVGSYKGRGSNGSSVLNWRGPYEEAADAIRMPARLEAGRNKVLLKIKNRYGIAGAVLAFSQPDGSRLEFTADSGPPDVPGERTAVEEPKWKRVARLDSRSYKSKAKTAVGGFKAKNKVWYGTDTEGGVKWRMFTVRPGFPKDSPSNLLWLKPNVTKDVEAVRIDVELDAAALPKMGLTFQGEGEDDGLSGWNLLLLPAGRDGVIARLERYDRLVYQSDRVEWKTEEGTRVLSLRHWGRWCTAEIDGEPLLDRVSIDPIPGRSRVGLSTWGPNTRIHALEFSKAGR